MKKVFAGFALALACATPVVQAQAAAAAPAAPQAAADPKALAAAQELLESMNFRAIAQNTFAQMRQQMPIMLRQQALAAINKDAKLTPAKKQAALAKLDEKIPKATAMTDGVFKDPTLIDDMLRETAQLYARHFTAPELHEIAVFYRTPAGKKMLTSMPQIIGESMQISQRLVMPRVAAVLQKMPRD